MGLERTAAILQDVRSVYETDGYQAIMDWVAEESGVAFGESEVATKAHRILADHGRGMTFLVGDGVTPSNEGRGYVLRRIIRRAVQQARTIGLDELWRLSDVVVEQMGQWYPELPDNRDRIRDVLRAEEERFTETLARGMKLFEDVAAARRDLRQGRLRPHGDLRLPVRADHGARGRARAAGRRGRLPRADGRAPRDLAQRGHTRRRAACPGRRPTSSATTGPRC